MILQNIYYLVRDGNFGTNYNWKLYFGLAAFIVCMYFLIKHQQKDYLYIFSLGSLIWFGIEVLLESLGYRNIGQVYLFNFPIPMVLGAFLRGISESGFAAVAGVLAGDTLLKKKNWFAGFSLIIGLWIYTFIYELIKMDPIRNIGGEH